MSKREINVAFVRSQIVSSLPVIGRSGRKIGFILAIFVIVSTINLWAQKAGDLDAELVLEAAFGHTARVQQLLEAGTSIEAKDRLGKTPLMAASEMGQSETVAFLLDKGASIEAESNGDTALNIAAQSSNENTAGSVKVLLSRGAKIEASHGLVGETPLMQAASAFTSDTVKYEKVKLLLDKGAKIEVRNIVNETALIKASFGSATKTVEILLQRGAAIEDKDRDGRTALMKAASVERGTETVKLLLAKKADIKATDKDGRTPLIWAALYGSIETVRVLLERGANIQTTDKNGDAALDYAMHMHKTALAQLLQSYGAVPR